MNRILTTEQLMAWRAANRPWRAAQVEKDYLLDRLLVAFLNDPLLKPHLVYAGGTCLNKVHSPVPARFSEDLDFVTAVVDEYHDLRYRIGGVILDLAEREGWHLHLLKMRKNQYAGHRMNYTDCDGNTSLLKIDLARKPELAASAVTIPYSVSCDWFAAEVDVACEPLPVIAATKVSAVSTRRQPRDAFDLHYVRHHLGVTVEAIAAEMDRVGLDGKWNAYDANATLNHHWNTHVYRERMDGLLSESSLKVEADEVFESARETVSAVGTAIGREMTNSRRRKLVKAARKQREAEQQASEQQAVAAATQAAAQVAARRSGECGKPTREGRPCRVRGRCRWHP